MRLNHAFTDDGQAGAPSDSIGLNTDFGDLARESDILGRNAYIGSVMQSRWA